MKRTYLWLLAHKPVAALVRGLIVVGVAVVGYLFRIDNFSLDFLAYAYRELPQGSPQVVLIGITRDDYKRQFNARSPLDPIRLNELITKILEGQPAVVGVDIDTADKTFAVIRSSALSPKIIWARDIAGPAGEHTGPIPSQVLGGESSQQVAEQSGLAVLMQDAEDGAIRRYRRLIDTTSGLVESFPFLIAKKYSTVIKNQELLQSTATSSLFDIRYSDIPARRFFTVSNVLAPGFDWKGEIRDKVVVLGGQYDRADRHKTPYGEADGIEVIANVVETELSGRAHESVGVLLLFAIALCELLWFLYLLKWRETKQWVLWIVCSLLLFVIIGLALFLFDRMATLTYFIVFTFMLFAAELFDRFLSRGKEDAVKGT